MEESTCHEMIIHLSQRFSSMLGLFLGNFSLVLNMIFILTLKECSLKREQCEEISASMVLQNVWHDTSSVGKNCQYL